MTETERDYEIETYIRVSLLCFLIATFGVILYVGLYRAPEPLNYYETAPNGVYDVLLDKLEDGYAWFPMCESCGSELHGKWKVEDSALFPVLNVWYRIRLIENVVVEASLKYHMNPLSVMRIHS